MISARSLLVAISLLCAHVTSFAQTPPVAPPPSPLPPGSIWAGSLMCGAQKWQATLKVDGRDSSIVDLVAENPTDGRVTVRLKVTAGANARLDMVPMAPGDSRQPFEQISGALRDADTPQGFRQPRISWRPVDGPMPKCRPVFNIVDVGAPDTGSPQAGTDPAGSSAAMEEAMAVQNGQWKLSSDAATRTLFSAVEMGGRLALPSCQNTSSAAPAQPCSIPVGNYAEFPEQGLAVHFVYLSRLPEWMRPGPNGLRLSNCADALPSRRRACQEEQARLIANTPPGPALIAVTHKDHVIEVFFFGADSMCDVGAKVFEQKWGKPTFVNNDGTNADWTFADFGASILCNAIRAPEPIRHIVGDGLPARMAKYTVRLIPPFQSFSRTQQFQQKIERQRLETTGPKL